LRLPTPPARAYLIAYVSSHLRTSVSFHRSPLQQPYWGRRRGFHGSSESRAGLRFQGEYVGEDCGAQVIALGDGKFRIVGYSGGLPGAVAEFDKQVELDAAREGEKVVINSAGWSGSIKNGKLVAKNDDGDTYELKHVVRESPTLGAKPPEGAVVLFNGSNADAWEGGKLTEDGFLQGGTKSKAAFGDCTLHVEFRTPFMPAARGQARGNSGVYLQDRYEAQVLDSFGLKGENNEAGGIYTKSKPRLNMCFPPLSWQTYDIDFQAAKFDAEGKKTKNAVMSVKLNGVLCRKTWKSMERRPQLVGRKALTPDQFSSRTMEIQWFTGIFGLWRRDSFSLLHLLHIAPLRMHFRPILAAALGFLLTPLPLLAQTAPQVLQWDKMDLGPFHTGTFKVGDQRTVKGIAIKVGSKEAPATVLFDPELLRMSAGWIGGFVKFPRGRGGLEGQITPNGAVQFSTEYAPGWSKDAISDDPRDRHQGHLPAAAAKWRGLYTQGQQVILSYTVGNAAVLEAPGFAMKGNAAVFTRTFRVGKTATANNVLICDVPGANGSAQGSTARLTVQNPDQIGNDRVTMVGLVGGPEGASLQYGANGRVTLALPPLPGGATFQVAIWAGTSSTQPATTDLLQRAELPNLEALTKGGKPLWGEPITTAGKLSTSDSPYVADEILLPDDNPYGSWLRPGGHDFFPDGTLVLANLSGDVWLVTGLDEKLEKVQWKRFATGLFQPLGCKVVAGKIYVLGRDQITRLHDLNKDGEADFYENFNNDCIVTDNYHEFAMDLQTDSEGNFYYAKGSPWEPTVTSPHQGCLMKVSKDGSKLEIVATGLRAPNGVGIGPKNQITVSDNEGHWIPANKVSLIKPGGFYGMVTAAHKALQFKKGETEFTANPSDPAAQAEYKTNFWGPNSPMASGFEPPLFWLPKQMDNSPGGEVWVPQGDKWGPSHWTNAAHELRQVYLIQRPLGGSKRADSGWGRTLPF
jgi:hypothetical protein